MRIAVWNCNMRLHDKLDRLATLRPDLAVVPECACPEVLLRRVLDRGPSDFAWDGANPAKGTVGRVRGATVGRAEVWVSLSDHVPVVVELGGGRGVGRVG